MWMCIAPCSYRQLSGYVKGDSRDQSCRECNLQSLIVFAPPHECSGRYQHNMNEVYLKALFITHADTPEA